METLSSKLASLSIKEKEEKENDLENEKKERKKQMTTQQNQILKKKLQEILKESSINHIEEINKIETLKHAFIYCKINRLSGQISGPLLENYIKNKYNMIKNNASECKGDLQYQNFNYEIKISNGGKNNNKFNFVQIRVNHHFDFYLLMAYYIHDENIENLGELFIFQITKEHIKQLILNFGGYAHGTVTKLGNITIEDLNKDENDKEYALRPKFNDKCWIELLKYRVDESFKVINC